MDVFHFLKFSVPFSTAPPPDTGTLHTLISKKETMYYSKWKIQPFPPRNRTY